MRVSKGQSQPGDEINGKSVEPRHALQMYWLLWSASTTRSAQCFFFLNLVFLEPGVFCMPIVLLNLVVVGGGGQVAFCFGGSFRSKIRLPLPSHPFNELSHGTFDARDPVPLEGNGPNQDPSNVRFYVNWWEGISWPPPLFLLCFCGFPTTDGHPQKGCVVFIPGLVRQPSICGLD